MKLLVSMVLAGAVCAAATSAKASTVAAVESGATTLTGVTVTSVLDSYNSTYTFTVADSTGSIEMYGIPNYAPNIGDVVDVSGFTYAAYKGQPEISTTATVQLDSTGAPLPTPSVSISQLLTGSVNGAPVGAQYITLSDVVFEKQGVPITAADFYVDDTNSPTTYTELYFNPNLAATAALIGGTTPTGLVNVTGVVDESISGSKTYYDFYPTAITPIAGAVVPEPASLGLLSMGAIGLLARRRK